MYIPDPNSQRDTRIPNSQIRQVFVEDAALVAFLIKNSFTDVARRFGLTPENCSSHQSYITEDSVKDDFQKGTHFFIKVDRGISVGCLGIAFDDANICSIVHIGVLSGRRCHGFGTELVEKALDEAKIYGAKCLNVGIMSDDIQLKKWYEKRGFVEKETKQPNDFPFSVAFLEYSLE